MARKLHKFFGGQTQNVVQRTVQPSVAENRRQQFTTSGFWSAAMRPRQTAAATGKGGAWAAVTRKNNATLSSKAGLRARRTLPSRPVVAEGGCSPGLRNRACKLVFSKLPLVVTRCVFALAGADSGHIPLRVAALKECRLYRNVCGRQPAQCMCARESWSTFLPLLRSSQETTVHEGHTEHTL